MKKKKTKTPAPRPDRQTRKPALLPGIPPASRDAKPCGPTISSHVCPHPGSEVAQSWFWGDSTLRGGFNSAATLLSEGNDAPQVRGISMGKSDRKPYFFF